MQFWVAQQQSHAYEYGILGDIVGAGRCQSARMGTGHGSNGVERSGRMPLPLHGLTSAFY